jgi:Fic family protein
MAELIRKRWLSEGLTGLPRRHRQPCEYDAYLPDPIAGRTFSISGEVAADIADAEQAIVRLDASGIALTDSEPLARLLLRAESVASSRIEGLEIGARRLLRVEMEQKLGLGSGDATAREVLSNVDAMAWAVDSVVRGTELSTKYLLEVHRRLLAGTRLEARAGQVRSEQNWIGGSDYNPCSASFVPSPPENVTGLLDDLCSFCNEDSLPAIAQAAIAHAQFETIHPFEDGNGRTGRVLIQLILRRRGLVSRIVPPISLVLATRSRAYVEGLTATRYLGAPDSQEASDGINVWLATFAAASHRAVDDAIAFEERSAEIIETWRRRLGRVRAGSAAALLLNTLIGAPVLTVGIAAQLIGRSFQQTNDAIGRLTEAEILRPINLARRNRAFEATEVLDAFTDLERQLASPEGNTRVSRPSRRVPARRSD